MKNIMETIFLLSLGCFAALSFGETGKIDFAGYRDCIRIENATTRVILGPHCGGRMLEYSLGGKNALYLDPKQDGWTYRGQNAIDPYGGRLDIGPEKAIPAHPKLWLGPWTAEITGEYSARMTSVEDDATGVQLIRDFTLDKDGSRLTVTQTIRNITGQTKHWCHWSRTLAPGKGICLIPLSAESRFPNKYVMYENGPLINFEPKDQAIRIRDGFLEIFDTPRNPKLGMDSYEGWLAYLVPNELLLVKRFSTYPDRMYNEIAAITVCIYYFADRFCELEPIGPRETIEPGKSVSFTEEWWLAEQPFPKDRRADLKAVGEKAKILMGK